MFRYFNRVIAENVRRPRKTFVGRFVKNMFEGNNAMLETEAARLCDIKPDHQVLEVGFGPGIGIQAAYNYVKGGKGKIYGVDISELMIETATKRNAKHIRTDKVKLVYSDVENAMFNDDMFDRVFHCNCYYFWENGVRVARELHRVMKPGGVMVTTLDLNAIMNAKKRNLLQGTHTDPLQYMAVLESVGFKDVKIEYLRHKQSGRSYQAIFAYIGEVKENLWVEQKVGL